MPVSRAFPRISAVVCSILVLLALALCAPAFAQGDWSMFCHDPQRTGRSDSIGPASPVERPGFPAAAFMSKFAVGPDGTLYGGSDNRSVRAINPDGTERWRFPIGDGVQSCAAMGSDGTIYVGANNGKLYAINSDGSAKWEFQTQNEIWSSPAIGSDGTIYVGSADAKLYAINPDGSKKWDYDSGDYIASSPAIGPDGTIYVVNSVSKLCAVRPNGSEKWTLATGGGVAPSVADDGTVYIVSYDSLHGGKLLAISPNGTQKWEAVMGASTWTTSPAIGADGTVYAGLGDGRLVAYGSDGSKKWDTSLGMYIPSSLAIDGAGTIYALAYESLHGIMLHAINPDGSVKWETSVVDWSGSSPVMGPDGTVYVGSGDSKIHAFGPGETPAQPYMSISRPSARGTKTGPISYTLTYSNATDVTLSPADITLNLTGTAQGTIGVSGSGTSRTVTISDITGLGTIGILVAAGTASNATGAALGAVSGTFGVDNTVGGRGDWWTICHDAQRTGRSSHVGPSRPYLRWTLQTGDYTNSAIAFDDEGSLITPLRNGELRAIRPDGSKKWSLMTENGSGFGYPSIGTDGTIYTTCSDSTVHAISPNGVEWWQTRLGESMFGTPTIGSDGTIYLEGDYSMRAISPDGSEIWVSQISGLSGGLHSALGPDGTIYTALFDGDFTATSPDGTTKWTLSPDGGGTPDWSPPAVAADGTVYVGFCDDKLYAIRPNGSVRWKFTIGEFICCGPAIAADGTVYIASLGGEFFAVNPDGTKKWEISLNRGQCSTPVIDADGTVYVCSYGGVLYAINPDGSEKWRYVTGGHGVVTPVIGPDGTIYVGSDQGALYAIGSNPSQPPAVSISEPSVSTTAAGPVSYLVGYPGSTEVTLAPASIHLNKTGTANGVISVTGSGNTRTVTISGITGDGSLGISIGAGTASNAAGFAPESDPSETFDVLNDPPNVVISLPSQSSTKSSPVSYAVNYPRAASVSLSAADITLNKTGTANGTVTVTGSGNFARAVTISHISGEGALGISIGAGTAANAAGEAASAGPSWTVAVAKTRPSVTIGGPSVSATTGGPVSYTVTYSKAGEVTLTAADVKLIRSGTANGTVSVTGSGTTTRTVTISGIGGDGWLRISLAAGTASNVIGAAPATAKSAAIEVVNTLPAIAIDAPSKQLTKNGPVSYDVSYTHAASVSLTAEDVHLVSTGGADAFVSVSGSGTAKRKVTIWNITGDGSLSIWISPGSASNVAGDAPESDTSAAFSVVNTPPVAIIGWPSVRGTRNGPVSFEIMYRGATSVTLSSAQVHLTKTGTATGKVTVTGKGVESRTVTISKVSGWGTLAISIDAKSASNLGGYAAATGWSDAVNVGVPQPQTPKP